MTSAQRLLSIVTAEIGAINTVAADPLDATLFGDCALDWLNLVCIAVGIEDEFGIDLGENELAEMEHGATLRDVLAVIEAKLPETIPQGAGAGNRPGAD